MTEELTGKSNETALLYQIQETTQLQKQTYSHWVLKAFGHGPTRDECQNPTGLHATFGIYLYTFIDICISVAMVFVQRYRESSDKTNRLNPEDRELSVVQALTPSFAWPRLDDREAHW